ncbi:class I SAM-dependent methyltransferase [Streptomyces armeniacus]|uniref:Class I SAM-dependent methyltransferase n=1 Tax=Streptomyces armeniacus TaxID=83291 RepID=A0A345XYV6_9ACTN|nr:class I SAM-dependent methyltransferase [Streptomyces armeniacus]AXK36822.1 class I SAM-dependent methyltransferase [Streptomyces armeniacus]
MDRELIARLAHADHPVNSPLDDESVRRLLQRTVGPGEQRVLDLGCGEAAWLLRALAARTDVTAEGVDTSAQLLAKARQEAVEQGVGQRLVLHRHDAAEFVSTRPFDAVLCVGATHAFGGLLPTLDAAAAHLAPGGRVLVGDAYWECEPTAEARELLGEYEDLATTVERVVAHGWTPVHGHISTRRELDDFEWCWTGSLAAWALEHPEDPDSAEVLAVASAHRSEWLRSYRDSFGFVTLVLRRTSECPDQ